MVDAIRNVRVHITDTAEARLTFKNEVAKKRKLKVRADLD